MRHSDWQKRFWAAMEAARNTPFEWGTFDCVLFSASMADAVTVDGNYVSRAREAFSWGNEREALKLLSTGSLESLVSMVMGPMIPWPRLSMGDIVLANYEGREAMGVHDGSQLIVRTIEEAISALPWRYAMGGWKVP